MENLFRWIDDVMACGSASVFAILQTKQLTAAHVADGEQHQ